MRMNLSEEVEYLKAINANLRASLETVLAPPDIINPAWGMRGLEAKIFRALAREPGAVMPLERLYAICYSDGLSSASPKCLQVSICHMRPKLARFGMAIQGYRQLGYQLIGYEGAPQ